MVGKKLNKPLEVVARLQLVSYTLYSTCGHRRTCVICTKPILKAPRPWAYAYEESGKPHVVCYECLALEGIVW